MAIDLGGVVEAGKKGRRMEGLRRGEDGGWARLHVEGAARCVGASKRTILQRGKCNVSAISPISIDSRRSTVVDNS